MPMVVMTGSTALRSAWIERDRGFGQAFGSGGADVVLAQDLQHRRSGQAHDQRRAAEADGGRGNAQHLSASAPQVGGALS